MKLNLFTKKKLNLEANKNKIPLKIKLAYAVGNIGLLPTVAAMGFFLMIFYTDVALIPPAIAGMALTVGKIWDLIFTPIFGWLSDRTKSKYGRRRIYLIYGAIPLMVGCFVLWIVPVGLSPTMAFVWIVVTYIIFSTIFDMVYVPYNAMGPELTQDYDERTNLMTISSVGAVLGFVIGSIATRKILASAETPQIGYMIVGGVFGIIAGLSTLFVAWKIKEPAQFKNNVSKMPLIISIKTALKNKPFVMLVTAFGMVRLAFTLLQASLIYFVKYYLMGSEDSMGSILSILMISILIFLLLWKWVGKRWTKSISYIGGLLIVALCLICSFWLEKGNMSVFLIVTVFLGLGMASHWVMPFAMLPDIIEHDQLTTGERREGVFYGVYGLIDKIARTLAIVILSGTLELFHYVPVTVQTPETVLGIRLIFGPIPAVLIFLAIIILAYYPINRQSHSETLTSLREKNNLLTIKSIAKL